MTSSTNTNQPPPPPAPVDLVILAEREDRRVALAAAATTFSNVAEYGMFRDDFFEFADACLAWLRSRENETSPGVLSLQRETRQGPSA